MTQLINDKGVFRTTPATPGLLISFLEKFVLGGQAMWIWFVLYFFKPFYGHVWLFFYIYIFGSIWPISTQN